MDLKKSNKKFIKWIHYKNSHILVYSLDEYKKLIDHICYRFPKATVFDNGVECKYPVLVSFTLSEHNEKPEGNTSYLRMRDKFGNLKYYSFHSAYIATKNIGLEVPDFIYNGIESDEIKSDSEGVTEYKNKLTLGIDD